MNTGISSKALDCAGLSSIPQFKNRQASNDVGSCLLKDSQVARPVHRGFDLTPEIRPFRNTIWTKEGEVGMSRSRHTEAQIIAALKQVEAGRTTEDVAREQGVSKHTIYAWKARYGGMEVSEAEEVKHLRDENGRLKKLVAELSLDKDMLQSVIRKNSLGS